jgi:hypothetical protein
MVRPLMLDMRGVVGQGVEALDEDHLCRSFICIIPLKSVAQKASKAQHRIGVTLHTAAVVELWVRLMCAKDAKLPMNCIRSHSRISLQIFPPGYLSHVTFDHPRQNRNSKKERR